jgi:hypothetical protein
LAVGALATVNHSNIEGVVKKQQQQNVEKKKMNNTGYVGGFNYGMALPFLKAAR